MDDFLRDLKSSHFWLSVIIIGFIVNVLAAFFYQLLSSKASTFSSFLKKKIGSDEEKHISAIRAILADSYLILFYQNIQNSKKHNLMFAIFIAAFCILFYFLLDNFLFVYQNAYLQKLENTSTEVMDYTWQMYEIGNLLNTTVIIIDLPLITLSYLQYRFYRKIIKEAKRELNIP